MNIKEQLKDSQHINATLGLKYLNNNEALYLKVLNNFLIRYETLDIENLNKDELKTTMHTLKGLSATLGMESLTSLSEEIHQKPSEKSIHSFSALLKNIKNEIRVLS